MQYSQLSTRLAAPHQLNPKPEADDLVFGKHFTDHMLKVSYHRRLGGWQKPEIMPLENLVLHPAAKVFHYAVEVGLAVSNYLNFLAPDFIQLRTFAVTKLIEIAADAFSDVINSSSLSAAFGGINRIVFPVSQAPSRVYSSCIQSQANIMTKLKVAYD